MAKKKDFRNAPTVTIPVYSALLGEELVPQVHDVQEVQQVQAAQDVQEEVRTQGRKGMKAQRINMAFSDANLQYLHAMAALNGVTVTKYVNTLIDADRANHADVYDLLKQVRPGK